MTAREHAPSPIASASVPMLAMTFCEACIRLPCSKRKRCTPPATQKSCDSVQTMPNDDLVYTSLGVTPIRRRRKCIAPVVRPSQMSGASDLAVRPAVYLGNMRTCIAHSPRLVGSRSRRWWSVHATRALHCVLAVSSHSAQQ